MICIYLKTYESIKFEIIQSVIVVKWFVLQFQEATSKLEYKVKKNVFINQIEFTILLICNRRD